MDILNKHGIEKVLIVKDKPIVLKSIEIKFIKEGHNVTSCTSIIDAFTKIEKAKFDILITGMRFENEKDSILDLIRKFKENNFNSCIILIIESNEYDENLFEAFNIGADECVFSPVKINEIYLRTLLSIRKKDLRFKKELKKNYKIV